MAEKLIEQLRDYPSVEELLQEVELEGSISLLPRPITVEVIRNTIADSKAKLQSNGKPVKWSVFIDQIKTNITKEKLNQISRVINATGIVVHTNLGRAPLPMEIIDAIKENLTGYSNLEFDLITGDRGSRGDACERYLAELSEVESATVVNNCAAALFIILNTLANKKKVIISRGELIQIGGGFRIPDILKRAGSKLCEVGTTNITTLADYEKNIDSNTGLILKVHQSNFIQAGFTEEVSLKELVALGKKHNIPVVNDLGSGVFVDTQDIFGYRESTVQQSVRTGADLTCFSGDKLLGGMQAGLIVGRADLVKAIKKNPIFRALRVDKVVFSSLEKLISVYLNGTAMKDIPLWAMLSIPESELYRRGKAILEQLGKPPGLSIEATKAYVGGGAVPESNIPSVAIIFSPEMKAEKLIKWFREYNPPIIGRIEEKRFILDLKAVSKDDLPIIQQAITEYLNQIS